MADFPPGVRDMLNAQLTGWDAAMGLRFVHVDSERLVTELEVGDAHLQPYGLVHGGVYAGMIETTCSAAAAFSVFADGKIAVGLDNATSFLRAVRAGTLRCTAEPLSRGRRSHVWEGRVEDDRDRLVATGRVRLLILEPGGEFG